MMRNITEDQFNNALSIFSRMQEISAPDFFYTRLMAKMEKYNRVDNKKFQIKTIWVISSLILLLIANTILLKIESDSEMKDSNTKIETLASSYDQIISN